MMRLALVLTVPPAPSEELLRMPIAKLSKSEVMAEGRALALVVVPLVENKVAPDSSATE